MFKRINYFRRVVSDSDEDDDDFRSPPIRPPRPCNDIVRKTVACEGVEEKTVSELIDGHNSKRETVGTQLDDFCESYVAEAPRSSSMSDYDTVSYQRPHSINQGIPNEREPESSAVPLGDDDEPNDYKLHESENTNFSRENGSTNIVFQKASNHLDGSTVLKWLQKAEKGLLAHKVMRRPPLRPHGGEIFLCQCEGAYDFNRDEYTGFVTNGNNNRIDGKNQPFLKRCYKMRDEKNQDVPFFKNVYELRKSKMNPKIRLIHYMGDEKAWRPRAHGNSKCGKTFTSNRSKVKAAITSTIKDIGKTAKPIYSAILKTAASDPDFEDRQATEGPRDKKQVENYSKRIAREKRLLRCEYFSIYEMAKSETLGPSFIIKLEAVPHDIIVLGEHEIFRLAISLLNSMKEDPTCPQILSYDTTFDLGDTYVSALVMRNTYCEKNPIFPVAFLLHDRKLEAVHTSFWRLMSEKLNLQEPIGSIPIVTDREKGITNAIRNVFPSAKMVYCGNHIIQDVKHWIQTAGGTTRDDVRVLTRHTRSLLDATSVTDFNDRFHEYSMQWSEGFKGYFENNLEEDLRYRLSTLTENNFAAFSKTWPTNNISESMNYVVKKQNEWKSLRLDSLVFALFNLQLEYLNDFHRSTLPSGVGNHTLKPQHSGLQRKPPFKLPNYSYWTTEEFLELFRPGIYHPTENIEKDQEYLQSKSSQAKLICQKGLVSLNSASRTYTVFGLYNLKPYQVSRLPNGKDECSCISTGLCAHIIAVKYANCEDIPEDKHTYSLHVLKKRARGFTGKAGKKQPKAWDLDMDVIPAPDSECARFKLQKISTNRGIVTLKSVTESTNSTCQENSSCSGNIKNSNHIPPVFDEECTVYAPTLNVAASMSHFTSNPNTVPENPSSIQHGTNSLIFPTIPVANKDSVSILKEMEGRAVAMKTDDQVTSIKCASPLLQARQSTSNISADSYENPSEESDRDDLNTTISSQLSEYHCSISCFLLECTPDKISKSMYNTPTFRCLLPKAWICDDIVDNMIAGLIKSHGLENNVTFIESTEFQTIGKSDPSKLARIAARKEALNSDITLVCIGTGNHWILGVIVYRLKQIIMINSMRGLPASAEPYFLTMFKFVAATFVVANVMFRPVDWRFIIDDAVDQQINEYDCGLHVALNTYKIVRRIKVLPEEIINDSGFGRRWILTCMTLNELPFVLRQGQTVRRPEASHSARLKNILKLQEFASVQVTKGDTIADIISQLRGLDRRWNICESVKCPGAFSPADKQFFCVHCRRWFHEYCLLELTDVKSYYFLCNDCVTQRV